jgi:5'-methylthioadenosine phosphorylase
LICTSTDYDAWRTGHAPVTVEEVVKTLHTNAGNARAIAAGLMQDVYDVVKEDKLLDEIKGSMRFACITRKEVSSQFQRGEYADEKVQPEAARKKLSFILPYFSD